MTTPEQQRFDKYNRDPQFARELDARFAHQHKQGDSELSGNPANVTQIIEALNSTSTGDDFGNSYWFGLLVVVIFLVAIFLTNSCLGL